MKTSLTPALLLCLVALAGCGDGGDHPAAATSPAPTAPAPTTVPATTAPTVPAVTGPADLVELLTEHAIAQLPPGGRTVAKDGTGIEARLVVRAGRHLLEVHNGSDVDSVVLPPDSDTPFLLDVQLELGQAGAGWVIGHEGGDSTRLQVYVGRAGRLVAAAPTAGDPDLGGGFTAEGGTRRTWFNAFDRPFTRVATGRPGQYRLYGWAVSGPGEGGGGPDDLHPRLVAEDMGTICLTETGGRSAVARC